jgi:hypothetical protein
MLDAAAAGLYLRSSIDQETAGIRAFDRQPGCLPGRSGTICRAIVSFPRYFGGETDALSARRPILQRGSRSLVVWERRLARPRMRRSLISLAPAAMAVYSICRIENRDEHGDTAVFIHPC